MNLKNWGIRMKVLLYGYGLMGKKVAHQLREKDEFDLIGVVSYEFDEKAPEAMYSNLTEVQDRADVIIDFSHPNNLDDILAYAKKNKTKVVFATTGFSKEQLDKIEEASKEIAIFQSYNTSFGIQMVTKILRQVAKEFYDNGYDIEILEKHHNQKVILLIDEYDVPLDKSFLNGYYDDMVSFIRIFLGEALKTNDNTEFAIVTGCLRISKESIFTGVNNFKVFSINDNRFSDYFGFTNDEVREMLSYYGIIDKYETTKAWYDGYLFGKTEIYCPWDVLNHCDTVVNTDDIEPQAYWINSSGNDIIRKFIEMANSTTKSELELLIAGNTVVKTIKQELTYADLYSSIENMWSILYMTGYLTKRSIPERKQFELAIPNLEIREIFEEQIYEWFKDFSRKDSSTLNAFCQTFADGNAEEAQKQFTAFLRKTISIRDTYVKAAKKENFYHGILLGLLSYRDDWIVKSNVESGDGYSDIVIKIPDDEIGMIIEVKYGEDADMEKGCADALAQIERMNYSEILEDDEVQTIYKYGIACYKKRCKIVKA